MSKLVKKFGGTSLQTGERIGLAVEEVADDVEKDKDVISVVSAMGRDGDPYATDTLIDLLKNVSPDVDPLKQDLMMSCGEIVSASLFSHYIDSAGYDSVPVTGPQAGIFTDGKFGDARIVGVDPVRIKEYLSEGKTVVLAGFQGRTIKGEVTTLGRGGSDTTALKVGGSLNVEEVEIYTDVPGVAVVDPSFVDDPPFFSNISRSALLILAKNGASVIHPRAVSAAIDYGVNFSIKCSWQQGGVTTVSEEPSARRTPVGIAVKKDYLLAEPSCFEVRNASELGDESRTVKLDGGQDEFSLLPKEEVVNQKEIDARPVSVVTAVPTVSDNLSKLVDRINDSLDRKKCLGRIVDSKKAQFVVEPGKERKIVRNIYDLFY